MNSPVFRKFQHLPLRFWCGILKVTGFGFGYVGAINTRCADLLLPCYTTLAAKTIDRFSKNREEEEEEENEQHLGSLFVLVT